MGLNTQEKEVSVKNYKINHFSFTTSFILVMLRVIWDYVYDSLPAKMTQQFRKEKLFAHTLATP